MTTGTSDLTAVEAEVSERNNRRHSIEIEIETSTGPKRANVRAPALDLFAGNERSSKSSIGKGRSRDS
jgi:hypothetical protein